jgi:hypothetical protein
MHFLWKREKKEEKQKNDHRRQTTNQTPSLATPRRGGRDNTSNATTKRYIWPQEDTECAIQKA